jgi:hypothetical protein
MTDGGGRRWVWALALVLGLVFLAHLRFLVLDPRLPWDGNLCYDKLPLIFDALHGREGGWTKLPGLVLGETTGAYALLLALPMALGLPRAAVFELASLLWVLLALGSAAFIARRLFGGPAAAMATALLAGGWSVVVLGRTPWIHVPEIALCLLLLAVTVHDPGLRRWRSVALAALAGGLALSLRPSALVWVGSTAPLVVYGVLRAHPRRAALGRLAVVAAAWALGACPVVVELWPYLAGKLGRREGYEHVVNGAALLRQTRLLVGEAPLLLGGLGLALLAWRRLRPLDGVGRGPVLVLLAWLLTTPALLLGFRAGLDNFPAFAVALALLGAGGLAHAPRALWLLPGLAFLLGWLPQWLPDAEGLPELSVKRLRRAPNPGMPYRVDDSFDPVTVGALLDASCPPTDEGRCLVAVDHGLFSPDPEEPGRLELFLLARDRVELVPVYAPGATRWAHEAQAFASYGCDFLEPKWAQRRPGWQPAAREVLRRGRFQPAWEAELGAGCRYRWLTPGGVVASPDLLP